MKKILVILAMVLLSSLPSRAQAGNGSPQPFKSDQFAFSAVFNGPVKHEASIERLDSGPLTQNTFISFDSSGHASYIQISTFTSGNAPTEDGALEFLESALNASLGTDDSGANTVLVQSDQGSFSSYPSTRSITNITRKDGQKFRVETMLIYVPERFSLYHISFMQQADRPMDPASAVFFGSLTLLTPRAVAADAKASR